MPEEQYWLPAPFMSGAHVEERQRKLVYSCPLAFAASHCNTSPQHTFYLKQIFIVGNRLKKKSLL